MNDGPMFYLIHGVRSGYEDFTVEGIFTKEEDANDFVKELEKLPYMQAVAQPQFLPLQTVKELLVQDRLGAIAKVLQENLETE